jgi:hypothetical protein
MYHVVQTNELRRYHVQAGSVHGRGQVGGEPGGDHLISYRSLSGMPIGNHAAAVRALRRFVRDCADGLAAYAGASPEVPVR